VSFTPSQIRNLEGVPAVAVPAALVQAADPVEKVDPPAAETPPPAEAKETEPPADPTSPAGAAASVDDGLTRPAAARITIRLREAGFEGWSEPVAWAASVTQLLGGALIFVGLLTRLWAFLLAVVLGGSFWLVTVQAAGMFDLSPFEWAAKGSDFQEMFFTLAMFVLAFGVLLTGPGMVAMDTLLWKPARLETDPTSEVAQQ
jgi:uncharacterized membrane protein YphA (DoxX/SURF4 family)